jgi:hypothetical protein
VAGGLPVLERGAIDGRAEVLLEQLDRIHAVDRADRRGPHVVGELVVMLGEQLAPGVVGGALGLQHRAVEVEEERPHGRQGTGSHADRVTHV